MYSSVHLQGRLVLFTSLSFHIHIVVHSVSNQTYTESVGLRGRGGGGALHRNRTQIIGVL